MTAPALATAVSEPRAFTSRASNTAEFVERSLAENTHRDGLLRVAVTAPLSSPEVLLDEASSEPALVWDPPAGSSELGSAFAGLGAVRSFELRGPGRFPDLIQRSRGLWRELETVAEAGCEVPAARLFGGFSFAVGSADEEPWSELGDGYFFLPRFTWARRGESAILSLTVDAGQELGPGRAAEWAEQVENLLGRLEASPRPTVLGRPAAIHRPEREAWDRQIEAIRHEILAGRFQKIVAASHTVVEFADEIETAALLGRLGQGRRGSTRFAFRRGGVSFLGASPERLIARRGLAIETESLAGSIAAGAEHAPQLLGSGKDLHEHQLVVDSILRRLESLCRRLEVPEGPRILEARSVQHLHTPISGELREPRHVLELVETLHPTPAVGGVPTEAAVRWIVEHEPAPRGWYAGPVGWFDASGDGEFAVALRSCLLRGREAHVYAGAGIVRDSDPELEYAETELKKRPILGTLGVEG